MLLKLFSKNSYLELNLKKNVHQFLVSRHLYQTNLKNSAQNQKNEKSKFIHPYKCLYPWNTFRDFVDHLENSILYNDGKLIALEKPYGIGTYTVNPSSTKYNSLSKVYGSPNYCLNDALNELKTRLNLKELHFIKNLDRFSSGIVLLGTSKELKKNLARSSAFLDTKKIPTMVFSCITSGYPLLLKEESQQRVRIRQIVLDNNTKDVEITTYPGFIKEKFYRVNVFLNLIKKNENFSTSLIDLHVNKIRWNFVRCYAASRSAFILGDLRFSNRVKKLLGQNVLLKPSEWSYNPHYEPLSKKILDQLDVSSNFAIPLMLHLDRYRLDNFYRGKQLEIKSKQYPKHFQWTLERLNLLEKSN